LAWLRLAGAAGALGLLVAIISRHLLGADSITDSAAAAILHAAIGAMIGGLVAWYSPSLPAALLRVAWIEGGLVAAEWIFARLMPISERSVPVWFGLPILHASLLVSLIGGPRLALVTFVLIRLARPDQSQQINRQWWVEAIAIVGGCLASGLLIVAIFGSYLNNALPPADPSQPLQNQQWLSGTVPEAVYSRFDKHQDGFIVLPGWLPLNQAVAILISLAMIIPVSAALYAQTQRGYPRLRRPASVVLISFAVSAAIGVGLNSVAAMIYGQRSVVLGFYEYLLSAPLVIALLWGAFGLVSGFVTSALYSLAGRSRVATTS